MRGGMGNMGDMMRKAQKMQMELAKMQEDLKKKEVEASAGGGAVTVKVNGAKEVLDIKIDKELASSGDNEMLQDLVKAAVNEAMNKAQAMMDEESKKIAGGLNIPGLF